MPTTEKYQFAVVPEYQAKELGVPFNVVLVDSVKQRIATDTGEVERVIIPNIRGLIKCVAITRILIPRKLSGTEIKFIRKAFKLPAKQVAEMIGVTPEHLSRCESGERVLSEAAEKCFRISIFIEQFRILDDLDGVCGDDEDLKSKLKMVRDAVRKIGAIISDMKISAAFEPQPLELKFYTTNPKDPDLFEEDNDADWQSNDLQVSLAA